MYQNYCHLYYQEPNVIKCECTSSEHVFLILIVSARSIYAKHVEHAEECFFNELKTVVLLSKALCEILSKLLDYLF